MSGWAWFSIGGSLLAVGLVLADFYLLVRRHNKRREQRNRDGDGI